MQPTHKHARVSMVVKHAWSTLVDYSFEVAAPHKDARVTMAIRYGLRRWVADANNP